MQLAVISMVINLLVLAWVPGHISIPRYGKEMKQKQNFQPEAGGGLRGKQGREENLACQRMVISNFVSSNLQKCMLETPFLLF